MKFVQRDMGEAAEASNPGANAMRREIVFLIGITAALLALSYLCVGWIVEAILPHISAQAERSWFQHFSLAQREVPPANAEERTRFLAAQKTLVRLTRAPGVLALDYRLVLLEDETPNAFAFPGGTIAVNRGLLKLLESETSMAFVLGHELGHFAHRDHLRGIGRAVGRGLVMALIFGDAGQTLSANATAVFDLAQSRQAEASADMFGLQLVHTLYGQTEGTDALFLWLEERERQPAWAYWLQTHPDPGERLKRLRATAKELTASP